MNKYWVDAFTQDLVEEKEPTAPPERYYEYIRGNVERTVIETYVVSYEPLELVSFAWNTDEDRRVVAQMRKLHLDRHTKLLISRYTDILFHLVGMMIQSSHSSVNNKERGDNYGRLTGLG